jgi:hypothetical protein
MEAQGTAELALLKQAFPPRPDCFSVLRVKALVVPIDVVVRELGQLRYAVQLLGEGGQQTLLVQVARRLVVLNT